MKAGQIAVVVGACGGLGRHLIHLLFRRGLRVWGIDRDAAGLEEIKKFHARQGETFDYSCLDILKEEELRKAIDDCLVKHGRIDFWINGAGIAHNQEFHTMPEQVFDKVFAVNFYGVVYGTRLALEVMEKQASGQILNLGSVAGHVAAPFMSPYVASKFAVIGFSRSLQTELALRQSPVTVQIVSPGFVNTGMIRLGEKLGFPEWLSFLLAKPEDVAKAIVNALRTKSLEVNPTINGKLMLGLHRFFPQSTRRSSRVLLTRGLKDLVLKRYHVD